MASLSRSTAGCVRQSDGFVNTANSYRVWLPAVLGGKPVRLEAGCRSIAFALRDARGTAEVSGSAASYADALAGVSVRYDAQAQGVKESLVLANARAARSFAFDVTASAGLTPRLRAGVIELRDAEGVVRFTMAAPYLQDAKGKRSHRVKYALKRAPRGWTVTVSAEDRWLDDPDRAWPVVLDPTVYPGVISRCILDQTQPTTNLCALPYVGAGSATVGALSQTPSLLRFDVQSAIPADAEILQGTMITKLRSQQTTTPKTVFAHPVTRDWSGPTWNNATSATAWTAAGGDFATAPAAESNPTVGGTGAVGKRVSWICMTSRSAGLTGAWRTRGSCSRPTAAPKTVLRSGLSAVMVSRLWTSPTRAGSAPRSISDSQGRPTTFTATSGRISKLTDPAGRDTTYTYTGNLLTGVTDSSGKTSSFAYTGELMTKITTPSGRITTIEYFPTSDIANAGRVKKLTRVTASTTDINPTWTFAYTVRRDASSATPSTATVIDPDNDTTTYEFGPDATGQPDARPTKATNVMSSDGPSDSGSEPKDIDDATLPEDDPGDGDGDNYDCLPEPDETFCGSNDSTEPDAEPPLDPGASGTLLGFSAAPIGENNWGLSDNNPQVDNPDPVHHPGEHTFDIFTNTSFKALSVHKVRLIVPYDTALLPDYDWSRRGTYAWIKAAIDAGKRPLISFEKCAGEREDPETRAMVPCNKWLPSVEAYKKAVAAFLKDHPDVKDYTAWNEPNLPPTGPDHGQPTGFVRAVADPATKVSGAERAGQFWLELRRQCAARTTNKCIVAAGDFLDTQMNGNPTKSEAKNGIRYLKQYRAGMNYRRPTVWAWHAYSDGEAIAKLDAGATPKPKFGRLRNFVNATRSTRPDDVSSPPIWLTEQGATKWRKSHDLKETRYDENTQAKIARFLVTAPSVSKRIKRFYYYHLRGDNKTWDSGLLRKRDNSERPVFYVYRKKTNPTP